MGIVNVTPDSFWEPSRVSTPNAAVDRVRTMLEQGADIIDIGAVSTRPGSAPVSASEEWGRLEPVLRALQNTPIGAVGHRSSRAETAPTLAGLTVRSSSRAETAPTLAGNLHTLRLSVDTTRAEIVRRVFDLVGPFIVNDISAGEDDPDMLPTVGELELPFIAMHKRGGPQTMDGMCDYPGGVVPALLEYFREFDMRASRYGIRDWILDPGLGFAKTSEQCWEILRRLPELRALGRPILIGAADKRFTRSVPEEVATLPTSKFGSGDGDPASENGTVVAHRLAIASGADILRVHEVTAAKVLLPRGR